ncbi:MAG: sulfotransferase domain-containing protein [Bacteroidota bacterium]
MKVAPNAVIRTNSGIRESLRQFLSSIAVQKENPTQKDIIMFSCRRTGSTWLMECLGAEPGLRFINEPFGPKYINRSVLNDRTEFKDFQKGHKFFQFDANIHQRVEDYLVDARHTKICGPYDPTKPNFHFRYNRRLFKVLVVNPVIDFFFDQEDHYQFLYLLRHPIPTILSSFQLPRMPLLRYLEEDSFRDNHLDEEQIGYIKWLAEHGNEYQLWAAEWVLDQLVPWKYLRNHPDAAMFISYEEMVASPRESINKIAEYCDFQRPELILRELNVPSASTTAEKFKQIGNTSAEEKLRAWRNKIDRNTQEQIFEVINRFGVDFYSLDSDMPSPQYMKTDGVSSI